MSQPVEDPPGRIRLLVFDVDGVLTDGGIWLDDDGRETKQFHVRDGLAIRAAARVGMRFASISGRASRSVMLRLGELGVKPVLQGISDKAAALESICADAGVAPDESAFLGDDLIDISVMRRCGYPMAVADAVEPVRAAARYVTSANGGHGAAREAIEHLLKANGLWEKYLGLFGV